MATDSNARATRSEQWSTQLGDAFGGLRADYLDGHREASAGALDGRISSARLGRATAFHVSGSPQLVRRTQRSLAAAESDPFKVCIQQAGRAVVRQGETEVVLKPGQMALYDTGRPYDLRLEGDWACAVMTLPRNALGLPKASVSQAMTHPWATRNAPGSVLFHLLVASLKQREAMQHDAADATASAAHLGEAGVALLASIVSDGGAIGSDDILRAQVSAYVRAHLTDPDLSHNSVAVAHTMSPRSLHRLFHAEPQSVMEMVRSLRLDAIRAALADPLQSGRSTTAIASHWGYSDAAHFNRAFRGRFGTTPGAHRRAAQHH